MEQHRYRLVFAFAAHCPANLSASPKDVNWLIIYELHRGVINSHAGPVRLVNDVPNARRLGYILDFVRAKSLAGPMHGWLKGQPGRVVALEPGKPVADAPEDRRWHLLVNQPLQVDI